MSLSSLIIVALLLITGLSFTAIARTMVNGTLSCGEACVPYATLGLVTGIGAIIIWRLR